VTVIAADIEGRITSFMAGSMPRRERGAGRLPAPGADSRWAWRGFVPLSDRRRMIDPAAGFVATANHDPFAEGDYRSSLSVPGEYDAPWRIRRIRRELASRDDWDIEGFRALQGDVASDLALAMLKQMRTDLEAHGGSTAAELLQWDGRMDGGHTAPYLFSRLVMELGEETGGDEAMRDGIASTRMGASEILRLLAGGLDEAWWDDVTTPGVESRDAVFALVLNRIDASRLGQSWGSVHQVRFEHPFVEAPLVGRVIGRSWSRGPFAVGGDGSTVNANYWELDRPFEVTAIASARFIAEVGNWDETVLVLPTGQSGRPWSQHYADQMADWLRADGVKFPFSVEAVDRAATARLVLLPGE
jgi:penicillin amidase